MKTKKLLAALALISVVLVPGCKKDQYLAKVGVCPLVVSTIPASGAVGVPLNQVVSATFNEQMNPATITSSSFTLTSGVAVGMKAAVVIDGVVTYSGVTATFTPSLPLTPNTTFTGRMKSLVKDLMGNALQTDYVWTFTTGIQPTVVLVDPVVSAINVVLNKIVTATFSVPMDPLTINTTTFNLKQGVTPIAGTVTYTGTTATLTTTGALTPNTVYTGTITAGAKNAGGIAMANDYVWTFNTGISPTVISTDPLNSVIGVPLNKIVATTFSVPMDPLTLNTTTFTLKQGSTAIAGAVTYTGSTASFTPTIALTPNTVYTGTITTGAKNVVGIPLANNYVWTFTTGIAPTVTLTSPLNLETGVALNKVVAATFSVPMDPLTITGTNFTLKQGTNSVAGAVTYTGSTASFTPTLALLPNTVYTGTITTGAKNVGGIPLAANYTWTFTTGIAPTVTLTSPLNLETGVALNKVVTATFSVPMDPLTITGTTFTLKQGTNSVAGAVTYTGSTASFTPTLALSPNTVYTGTITTGAKNVGGISFAADYSWIFTTIAGGGFALNVIAVNGTIIKSPNLVTYSSGAIVQITATPGTGYAFTSWSVDATGSTNPLNVTMNSDKNITANFTAVPPFSPVVNLNSAGRFGILSGVGISNNAGFSVINNMDVGISPGARSSVTGFPPATVVGGAIYASDDLAPPGTLAMLTQAKLDLTNAYLFAEGATAPAPVTVSGDQGGKTLAPGIYKSTSTLLIQAGDLTLDGQGDPNATWIFQVASAFTTVGGAGGNVILTGGAQAKNIFWQTGSSAVIGDYTSFYGNVLALQSITMNSHATAVGRMLARNGSVVMTATNIINKP